MNTVWITLALTASVLTVAGLAALFIYHERASRLRSRLGVTLMELERERKELQAAEARLAERTRSEEFLFESAADMQFIFAVSAEGVPGRFLRVNSAACAQLGYSRERLLALSFPDLLARSGASPLSALRRYLDGQGTVQGISELANDDRLERELQIETRRFMREVLDTGRAVTEQGLQKSSGETLPVLIDARRFAGDTQTLVVLRASDISGQMETLEALKESERRARDFFTHSAIGAAIYDGQRKLSSANRTCLRIFGVPDPHEFARINFFDGDFVPPDLREALLRGESSRYEAVVDFESIRLKRAFISSRNDKAHLDVLVSSLGMDAQYRPKGYFVQVQDLTSRRQMEEALHQSQMQLQQAQKMQAIGTLAGGIAHDFNNILTPILGYTELTLTTCAPTDHRREFLQEVVKASLRAKDLANQILTFSRQVTPEGQPIRLIPLVKEVLKLQAGTVPKNIEVVQLFKTEHDLIVAQPTQIHQVLMNLCTNAVYAMQRTGGKLEVALSEFLVEPRASAEFPGLSPGRYVRISVRDTGSGIPSHVVERIFEPFFTTKERGEGTGMGLAVVHGIVSSLKGGIRVDSKEGAGTVFHIALPLLETAEEHAEQQSRPLPRGTENVIFVDDEPEIVKLYGEILRSLGYRPLACGSAPEALAAFQSAPARFAALVTDQVMPEMSGTELALKVHAIRPELPVILCTGFSEAFTPDRARMLGIRAVLMKPVPLEQLAENLRRAIDSAGRPIPPMTAPPSAQRGSVKPAVLSALGA